MAMTNRKKNFLGAGLIYVIVLALINVLVFTIFKPGEIELKVAKQAFWWSYAFMTLAFILQFSSMFFFDRKNGIDAVFMGIPLYKLSFMYFIAETFIALLFMILAAFEVKIPLVIVIVLQVLLLGIFLVVAVMALLAKNHVAAFNEKIKTNVRNIRNLVSQLDLLVRSCNDVQTRKSLNNFLEDIKYSDPMSTNLTAELDDKIQGVINLIKDALFSNNMAAIDGLAKQGQLLVRERNNIIAMNK